MLITIIWFVINKSFRKEIRLQGLHDLSNLRFSSSLPPTPFLVLRSLSVLIFISKNSHWESLGDVATLANVGCTSYDLNVATLGRRDVEAELSSDLLFKSPHNLKMPYFSPEMHKKLSIRYTMITALISR